MTYTIQEIETEISLHYKALEKIHDEKQKAWRMKQIKNLETILEHMHIGYESGRMDAVT